MYMYIIKSCQLLYKRDSLHRSLIKCTRVLSYRVERGEKSIRIQAGYMATGFLFVNAVWTDYFFLPPNDFDLLYD